MLFANSYVATKTRSNIDAPLPRGREIRYLQCRRCCKLPGSLPNRLSPPLATFSLRFFFTLTFPTLSRFPSVLICLFHHVCRSTICKILANPRKFVGFRFICKASGSRFSDFYIVAPFIQTNERQIFMSFSISEIVWDKSVYYCSRVLLN